MPLRRMLALLALTFLAGAVAAEETATISRKIVLRAAPARTASAVRSLEKGEEVEIVDPVPQNEYLHVQTEDNLDGWALARYVKVVPTAAAAEAKEKPATSVATSWAKPAPQAKDFTLEGKTCGADGDGANRDKGTNRRKNRTDIPTAYHAVTWRAIHDLPVPPAPMPKSRDKFSAAQLAVIAPYEGAAIETVGYVVAIKPQASNSESCNCGWHGERATDWHIALVEHVGDGEKTSIVVEPTPRIKGRHAKWTKAMLSPWLNSDRPVRISGWLLFDPQHTNHLDKYRSTLWEIHPITKIEVWDDDAEKWVDLDDLPASGRGHS
jgi:uncharacterized protein YraI